MVRAAEILRSFNSGGYEIFDADLVRTGEVVIRSTAWIVPRIGDCLVIESAGNTQDVEVRELQRLAGGGWNARCRVRGWV